VGGDEEQPVKTTRPKSGGVSTKCAVYRCLRATSSSEEKAARSKPAIPPAEEGSFSTLAPQWACRSFAPRHHAAASPPHPPVPQAAFTSLYLTLVKSPARLTVLQRPEELGVLRIRSPDARRGGAVVVLEKERRGGWENAEKGMSKREARGWSMCKTVYVGVSSCSPLKERCVLLLVLLRDALVISTSLSPLNLLQDLSLLRHAFWLVLSQPSLLSAVLRVVSTGTRHVRV
jgi:hypothetical protein